LIRGSVQSAFISRSPSLKPGHQTGGIDLKRGKHSMAPAGANADLDPTAAQLVQSAQVFAR